MTLSVYLSFNILATTPGGKTVGYSKPILNLTGLTAVLWPLKQSLDRAMMSLASGILDLSKGVLV